MIVLTTNLGTIKLDMEDDYQRYKTWATTINHMLMASTSFPKYELQFYRNWSWLCFFFFGDVLNPSVFNICNSICILIYIVINLVGYISIWNFLVRSLNNVTIYHPGWDDKNIILEFINLEFKSRYSCSNVYKKTKTVALFLLTLKSTASTWQ